MHLTTQNLLSRREMFYFRILAVLAVIVWVALLISIVGALYAVLAGVSIWFVNGLMVARIKADSVEASEKQFPELYASFREVCGKLDLQTIPRLFVLEAEGALNAFATRHSGRDFVVVFSSLYEGLGSSTHEMRFLLGHEIGHIKRRHVTWSLFLLPVAWIPLLGSAYRRSVEETCDRYGTFAAGDVNSAARAMTILSAGKDPGRAANVELFADQYISNRGFFISWNELISHYPTLSQRTYNILSALQSAYPKRLSRNGLAYLFALLFNRATIVLLVIGIYGAFIVQAVGRKTALNQSSVVQSHVTDAGQGSDEDFSDEEVEE